MFLWKSLVLKIIYKLILPEDCFNRKNGWWLKKNLEKLMKSWVKLEDVFLIRRGEKKICAGEFDFCRGEFAMTTVHPFSFFHREKLNKSENSCHSLHGCCNRLNINTLPCNVLVFRMSLMSLGWKVTSVTWHFCLSLHGELLKINELQWLCNEWHEFSNVESKPIPLNLIHLNSFLRYRLPSLTNARYI